jgi:PEP-CTERM motif
MTRWAKWFGMAVAAVLLGGAQAGATPIGPSCGTCQGSIYEISYSGIAISTAGPTDTWQITYRINTTGYNVVGGTHLDSVALKVSAELVSATLVSAPGGIALWNETLGGLNANGCSGSGSGLDCVKATAVGTSPAVPGGVYTWVFNLEIADGGLFTGTDQASVKARYVNDAGRKVGDLVSESITLTTLTLVPEPSTALLVLLGASLLGARRPRRA